MAVARVPEWPYQESTDAATVVLHGPRAPYEADLTFSFSNPWFEGDDVHLRANWVSFGHWESHGYRIRRVAGAWRVIEDETLEDIQE